MPPSSEKLSHSRPIPPLILSSPVQSFPPWEKVLPLVSQLGPCLPLGGWLPVSPEDYMLFTVDTALQLDTWLAPSIDGIMEERLGATLVPAGFALCPPLRPLHGNGVWDTGTSHS